MIPPFIPRRRAIRCLTSPGGSLKVLVTTLTMGGFLIFSFFKTLFSGDAYSFNYVVSEKRSVGLGFLLN